MIPVVDPTSKKINYDRIQMIEFDGAPKLRLQLGGIQKCDLSAAIARRVLGFIDSFQNFYQVHLTTDLFDELAWRYMGIALETVGLTERFYRTIVYPVYGNKNWSQVKICLSNIFRLPLIQADVVEKLYAVKPLPSEDGRTYGDRIKMLLKASGEDDRHPALISRILASLPDAGREIVINKFGSPESIKTVGELVHFMRSYPSIH
ncbi:hypothetical protein BGZ79_006206 [Entomortierella chlamydospora]|nr:hypothetical protein BGZ79_006206 [Entomortierella chlamydospora]